MYDWTPLIMFFLGMTVMGFLAVAFVVGTFSGTRDQCLSYLYAPIQEAFAI